MQTGTIVMLVVVLGIFGVTWALLVHTVNLEQRKEREDK